MAKAKKRPRGRDCFILPAAQSGAVEGAVDMACDGDVVDGTVAGGRDRRVSVVLATYNGARFLAEQLESLRRQTLTPYELVVGDDRSTDGTATIVADFARTAPFPVRFEANAERLHFGGNFLRAAARCGGRYVAFCDQDDVWLPEKLERSVKALEDADAVMVAHDAWITDRGGSRTGRLTHLDRAGVHEPRTLPPWHVFYGFSVTIRRDCLGLLPAEERGPDPIDPRRLLSHDRWAYFLGTTFGRTVYLTEPLVLYRQHDANAFGAGGGGGRLARLGKLVLANPADLRRHLDIARGRLALLAARRGDDAIGEAAGAGAEQWTRIVALYRLRLALALAPHLPARVAILARLARMGAYAPADRGGLSSRALVKDALAVLIPIRAEDPVAPVAKQGAS